MTAGSFFLQLFVVSAATGLLILGAQQWPVVQAYRDFAWIALIFFVILSILMFVAGRRAALSENKNLFTNAIIGFTMGKLLLSGILVLAYFKIAAPDSKWFLLPFFTIYLIYTIFETYFMMKLGKSGAT